MRAQTETLTACEKVEIVANAISSLFLAHGELSAAELTPHITPAYRHLIPAALATLRHDGRAVGWAA